jgi:hypothetical protein
MNYQGMGCKSSCRWVSLSVGVPLRNLGEGFLLQGTVIDSGRRALKMEHLSLQELYYRKLEA